MPTFTMTKTYNSVDIMTETDMDNLKNSTETFMNSTKLDSANIQVDAVGAAMTLSGANPIGVAMTSTGANAIAASMTTAGTGSIVSTLSAANADAIAAKFTSTGTASVVATSTAADADALVAKLTTSGANHIATASMNSTGFNAIGSGMTATGANAVVNTVTSSTSADNIANTMTSTGNRTILVGVARNTSTTPSFFDVGLTATSGSGSSTTLSLALTALNNKTYCISLVSDSSSGNCSVQGGGSGGTVTFKRDGTNIGVFAVSASLILPPGGFISLDAPQAGSFTYTAVFSGVTINFVKLAVWAL